MGDAIWTWIHLDNDTPLEPALGLIGEARRLAATRPKGCVTVVATGDVSTTEAQLPPFGDYGADRVILLQSPELARFHGELFAGVLFGIVQAASPCCFLMPHSAEAVELAGRLGALLESAVITAAVDLALDSFGCLRAVRPKANGYLFEELEVVDCIPALITFLPAAIAKAEKVRVQEAEVEVPGIDFSRHTPQARIIETLEADPGELDIEAADIVVAGGRGVGKGAAFGVMHELAQLIGGSVGGTRPVVDTRTLPFERQIGQTGKTVAPRLLINCGISGANEYTAGIEGARQVIAINTDPQARIFRFADLGVIADVHAVLPVLLERLKALAIEKKGA
jgi:electron transfer flavoprotein alpha subunit